MASQHTADREMSTLRGGSDKTSEEPQEELQPMLRPYRPDLEGPPASSASATNTDPPSSSCSPREDSSFSNGYKKPALADYNESGRYPTEPGLLEYDNENTTKRFHKGALYTGVNTGDIPATFNAGNYDQVDRDFSLPPNEKMASEVFHENSNYGKDPDPMPSPSGPVGWIGFGLTAFALVCLCISFASPFWIQAYPQSNNEFRNMGLWEVCFRNYMHYKDDSQQIYDGCFWVFDKEPKYEKLREWLLPPWFITVQVLVTLTFLAELATLIIMMMVYLHLCPTLDHNLHQTYAVFAASGLSFFITILTLIVGVMYGIMCGDRAWMHRPDLNLISWGYGFWIIQGIFVTAAGVCFYIEAQKTYAKIEEREAEAEDRLHTLLDQSKAEIGGGPSQPSFTEPPYGQSSYVGQISYDQPFPETPMELYANQPNYGAYDPNYQNYGGGGAEGYPEASQPPAYAACSAYP